LREEYLWTDLIWFEKSWPHGKKRGSRPAALHRVCFLRDALPGQQDTPSSEARSSSLKGREEAGAAGWGWAPSSSPPAPLEGLHGSATWWAWTAGPHRRPWSRCLAPRSSRSLAPSAPPAPCRGRPLPGVPSLPAMAVHTQLVHLPGRLLSCGVAVSRARGWWAAHFLKRRKPSTG